MEAEYMSLSDAAREAIARSQFYGEFLLKLPPPVILSDNQGALDITEDPTNYQKAKHIDIRYHFVRHALHSDQISIIIFHHQKILPIFFTRHSSPSSTNIASSSWS